MIFTTLEEHDQCPATDSGAYHVLVRVSRRGTADLITLGKEFGNFDLISGRWHVDGGTGKPLGLSFGNDRYPVVEGSQNICKPLK